MKINTRLDKIEKIFDNIKYKYQYRSLVYKDKKGIQWFTDNKGNRIPENLANEKLMPDRIVILPFDLQLEIDSVYGKDNQEQQKPKKEEALPKMFSDLLKAYG